jgi:uncharacterized protein (TIGR03083 family)
MGEWNATTFEGKPTILRVVRQQADKVFALIADPDAWERDTPCERWKTRDVVGHLVDTVEGYFVAFDAARSGTEPAAPHGLAKMSQLAGDNAIGIGETSREELIERLRTDFAKVMELLDGLSQDEWTDLLVTHPYMGPVPAYMYAAGQLMDFGVHEWDLADGTGRAHALDGEVADLLVPFMFVLWQFTVRDGIDTSPFELGIRITGGHNAGDFRVSVGPDGMAYEPGEVGDLPCVLEFDAGSFVLTAFGRCNTGTVRGDMAIAERFLNLFFRI